MNIDTGIEVYIGVTIGMHSATLFEHQEVDRSKGFRGLGV